MRRTAPKSIRDHVALVILLVLVAMPGCTSPGAAHTTAAPASAPSSLTSVGLFSSPETQPPTSTSTPLSLILSTTTETTTTTGPGSSSSTAASPMATVTQVVDGDTVHVRLGSSEEAVRLIGLDAPELGQNFADAARSALASLVGGKTVRLEEDVETRDQYGRLLAYLWVGDRLAQAEILREGLATLYTVPPNVKYVELLQAAQEEAHAAGRGMWGASSSSPLAIVSVNYNPPGDDNAKLNEEFVVFRVLVSGSLLGYSVEDESGHRYHFPDHLFSAGQTFKLHTGTGSDGEGDLYWGMTGSAAWNNSGDTVKVLDPEGRIVTSESY